MSSIGLGGSPNVFFMNALIDMLALISFGVSFQALTAAYLIAWKSKIRLFKTENSAGIWKSNFPYSISDQTAEIDILAREAGVICVKGVSPGVLFASDRARPPFPPALWSAEEIDPLKNFQKACFAGYSL